MLKKVGVGARIAACAILMALLSGCVLFGDKLDQFRWHFTTLPYFVFDNAETYVEPPQPAVLEEDVTIALAISGGGSRSAVFAAGVMEQLAHVENPKRPGRTILDNVDVISAVSGGSLAASYYCLYKPADFSNPEATTAFFQQFKSHMTVDLANRGFVHYLSHPWEAALKYYTRYRFVQTLANTMDQYLFRGANFEHINEREACGESPALIVNAASLDTGKKFLFTNLNVCKNFTINPEVFASRSPALQILAQVASSPIYSSFGFDSINSDISSFRLASAVSASSAYPILPGPSALIDYANNGYVHLADGGVNDNFGIDAIIQLYLARGRHDKPRRLVIMSLDATSPMEPRKIGDPNGYVSTIAYGEQATQIMGTRGQTFAAVVYNAQENIRLVPIKLNAAASFPSITSTVSTYSISEPEMKIILNCAIEAAQAAAPAIAAAISGAPAPKP